MVAENPALRQQLIVLHRRTKRPRQKTRGGSDRIFWLWLARSWYGWRESLIVVKPETVVRWHRQGFKYYWAWKSRHKGGRPAVAREMRDLIRRMSRANPLWALRGFTASCSSSALTWPRRRLPSTWPATGNHPVRVGGHSSIITSKRNLHLALV